MLTQFDKAIAGGLTSAILSVLARFGFRPHGPAISALGVLVTALVAYAAGHLAVYFAKNKSPLVQDAVQAVEKVVVAPGVPTPVASPPEPTPEPSAAAVEPPTPPVTG